MPLSNEEKETIRKNLAQMNKALAAAKEAIKNGDLAKAVEQLQDAAEAKHLAISNLPELPLAQKLKLPFFPIYDVFSELDRLINELHFAILVEKNVFPKNGSPAPAEYIPKLSELIEELMRNLILKYKNVESAALDVINDLIEVLVKIRKKVREKDLKDIEIFADPLFDSPRDTKLKFLELVGSDIHLGEFYNSFFDLDTEMLRLVKDMAETKANQEKTKEWIRTIDELERNKRKLEERFQ